MEYDKKDIKDCPFCGCVAKVNVDFDRENSYRIIYESIKIECSHCGASTKGFSSAKYKKPLDIAIVYWNKREEEGCND